MLVENIWQIGKKQMEKGECLHFWICLWITCNNFNLMLKVLTIDYSFWRLLNAWRLFIFYLRNRLISKYICWKPMELVQSKISSFNIKNIVEKLFMNAYSLLNTWLTVERLHNLLKTNNWLVKSKWKKVYNTLKSETSIWNFFKNLDI